MKVELRVNGSYQVVLVPENKADEFFMSEMAERGVDRNQPVSLKRGDVEGSVVFSLQA